MHIGKPCLTVVVLQKNGLICGRIYETYEYLCDWTFVTFIRGFLDTVQARYEGGDDNNKVDASIHRLINAVDPERISKHLFYLAKDPLPYRKLNQTLPGHQKNTLYEADDYLAGKLEAWGYRVEREGVRVQAFRRDTSKPKQAQYSPPKPDDPLVHGV